MVAESPLRESIAGGKRNGVSRAQAVADVNPRSQDVDHSVLPTSQSVALFDMVDDLVSIGGCVDAAFSLLESFGFDKASSRSPQGRRVIRSRERTLAHWKVCSLALGRGGWMKFAKYKFAAFFHARTRQEDAPPPSPLPAGLADNPRHIFRGIAGRYADRLLKDGTTRWPFLASILQVKKGCPRPDKSLVDAQVVKSVAALTTRQQQTIPPQRLLPWEDIPTGLHPDVSINLSRGDMEVQLDRSVDEFFPPEKESTRFTVTDRIRPYFPSTSATFVHKVEEGGAFRSVQQLAHRLGLTTYGEHVTMGPSLVRFRELIEEESIGAARNPLYLADTSALEGKFHELYAAAVQLANEEVPAVKAIGLAEALKVRVISKGPPLTGFVLKPLQRFMWRKLREHPCFRLIGTPVDVWQVQNRLGAKLGDDEFYLSGDYSAATDNLAPWVSERIARRIARNIGLSGDETSLFVRALTEHVFTDSERSVPQAWGQLMGSVVSFPVLCVANAAFCRWALEIAHRRHYYVNQTTLMVNGDDCVFRTNAEGLRLWKLITTFGGLTPSIGKYFASREFAQINSANFVRLEHPFPDVDPISKKPRERWFEETKYVNLGLLFGYKRSGEKVGKDAITSEIGGLGTRCRELIRNAPSNLQESLLNQFIKHHSDILKSCGVPWFIPEHLGGVGLPILYGLRSEDVDEPREIIRGPSVLDLQVAARIREQPFDKEKGKYKYPVGKLPADVTWNTHQSAMSRLPTQTHGMADEDQRARFTQLYGVLCVDALFSNGALFRKGDKGAEVAASRIRKLRSNERSWSRALKDGKLPAPLAIATVERFEALEPWLNIAFANSAFYR